MQEGDNKERREKTGAGLGLIGSIKSHHLIGNSSPVPASSTPQREVGKPGERQFENRPWSEQIHQSQ